MLRKKIFYIFSTIIITFSVSVSLQSLLASWSPPTANPPGSNVAEPINVGSNLQAKAGPLWIYSNSNLGLVEAALKIQNTGSINSFMVEDEASDATPFVIDKDGKVGIGTPNPQYMLDVVGKIKSEGLSIKDVFIEKRLPAKYTYPDLSPTCTVDENELPAEVLANGPCGCDISDDTLDCEISDLVETDYPGCFDRYKYNLAGSFVNFNDVRCHDLVAEGVKYFQSWEIEAQNNMIKAPFVSHRNCNEIFPFPGAELGLLINNGLKNNSCLQITLKDGVTYYWEELVTIGLNEYVRIFTKDGTNGATGGQAIIKMNNKWEYTYNGNTWRSPGRAIVTGRFDVSHVFLDENINDSRPITPASYRSSLFNIASQGLLLLHNSEISATEDIINFYGRSQNGASILGHLWIYRKPTSPRTNLHVVRAYSGWNFSGQNGTVGWSNPHVHLNSLINGTTGVGVLKYPTSLAEKARLFYADDVAASASDLRYKKDILKIENSLEKIIKLEGVNYKWKDEDYMNGKENIGLIAQDVEKIFPEVVITDEDGYKSVEYEKLIAPLIESVKKQQEQINNLEKKILDLTK